MKQIILFLSVLSLAWASDVQENLIKDLEQSLIAPCCWSGTVYDHGHPEMEKEIRQMVESGQTRQEIIDHFLARYGERILASPVASGFNLMAWITPIIIGLIGIAVFLNYLRTPKAVAAGKSKPKSDLKIPYNDQIERELKALD
ncbi:MAG: cytochrome c-type biogenesis protein CcmH [Candidatus Marinimicrobia bacterium]|nr:cytochrome c-type biogenesis protein CcmH [Candidatus Neomarinimicrobiota bacterium]